MTNPKEKAEELVNKYMSYADDSMASLMDNARYCALLCVEEILSSYSMANIEYEDGQFETYWSEVKQEIEKL